MFIGRDGEAGDGSLPAIIDEGGVVNFTFASVNILITIENFSSFCFNKEHYYI